LQQTESKCQGEEVPSKTERTEEDALPEQDITTWLTIASKSTADNMTLDPDLGERKQLNREQLEMKQLVMNHSQYEQLLLCVH
jgi:hypothetical protein